MKKSITLWFLFVLMCLGMGYPALTRFDPRGVKGTSDSAEYYALVASQHSLVTGAPAGDPPRPRILVALVAKPIYWIAIGHTGSTDPVLVALLLANALFLATAALILVDLGHRNTGNYAVALLGATIYLLNFAVQNFLLSGLIDSGEACLMLAVGWVMYTERWFLLPLLGVVGALAKETFLPFSAVFSLVWWQFATQRGKDRASQLRWIVATDVAAVCTIVLLWSFWYKTLVLPWDIAIQHQKKTSLIQGLWGIISSHELFYVFGWLMPLGVWRLNRLSRPWVAASFSTAVLVLAFGAWDDSLGNISRAMFNVAAPVLSLSVAILLAGSGDSTLNRSSSEPVDAAAR